MRSVVIVTSLVLGAIGAGVSVIAATTPASPTINCTSVQQCLEVVRASGFSTATVLLPADHDLHFVGGFVYPSEGSVVTAGHYPGQPEWGMRLEFVAPRARRTLEWVMDSWTTPTVPCPPTAGEIPLVVAGDLQVCDYTCNYPQGAYVHFWFDSVYYFADTYPEEPIGIVSTGPSCETGSTVARMFLLAEVGKRLVR